MHLLFYSVVSDYVKWMSVDVIHLNWTDGLDGVKLCVCSECPDAVQFSSVQMR